MFTSKEQLLIRSEQWKSFNAWEASSQKALTETDLACLFQWYSDAWEVARSLNPDWGQDLNQKKILHLQKTRNALAMLGELHERA